MIIKVTRRFTYVVEGKEYSDQKAANDAAKEANAREKLAILTEIVERAHNPREAVEAIMARFHIYNKNTGRRAPGVKRNKPVSDEKRAN